MGGYVIAADCGVQSPFIRAMGCTTNPQEIEVMEFALKTRDVTLDTVTVDELEYTIELDFEARRRLRSASSLSLNVRRTRLSTVGDRTFSVAWNSLPQHVTSAPSIIALFRGRLKAFLFRRSFTTTSEVPA